MRFGLLGQLEVRDDDAQQVQLGGRQPRAVLAALVAARGQPVRTDVLIDIVWGASPPASASSTLQSYVSRLRKALGNAGCARLESDQSGYQLVCPPESVDVDEFEQLCAEARGHVDAANPRAASDVLRAALALWRGPPLLELADHAPAVAEAVRLEEMRLAATESWMDVELELGRHRELVSDLASLVAQYPVRESLRVGLAIALYRSGRQTDALRSLADAASYLRAELGLEPGDELRDVEQAILQQAEWLRHTGPIVRSSTPDEHDDFVGRERELGEMLGALDDSVHDARFVVIEGDPGIGKTRLAEELRRAAIQHGSTTVSGRCDERGAAPALWPWLQIIRQLLPDERQVGPPLSDLLSGAVPLIPGQGALIRFEAFEAIADLLRADDSAASLVVLLDDIHWADTTSLELLRFLATRLERGVLVVATTRTLSVGRDDALTDTLGTIARRHGSQRHRLEGLNAGDAERVLKSTQPTPISPTMIERIHERAEGNPFYTIQLGRLLGTDRSPDDEVPPTVRDAVRCRLALLPAETVRLLEIAAVIGRDFDLALLAATHDTTVDECARHLESALGERILVDAVDVPGGLRFSHALVREVLLDGLTSLRRARLHLRVADVMEERGEDRDDAEVLAEHVWRAAALTGPERAAEALERAADVAVHRAAYTSAEDLLYRATRLRRSVPRSVASTEAELASIVRFLEVTQATRYFCGADHALLERARGLATELGRRDLARELLWFHWSSLATAADVASGTSLIEELHEICRTDSRPIVRSIGEASRGVAFWSLGQLQAASDHFELSVDLLEGEGDPVNAFDAESRVSARCFRLWTRVIMGRDAPSDVYAEFDAFIDRSGDHACPAISCFAGTTAAILFRFDDLDHFVRRARAADPSAQFAFWGGQLLMYEAMLAAERGAFDDAVALFSEGRSRYLSVGARSCLPTFEAVLGELLARGGEIDPGLDLVRSADQRLAATGEEFNRPFTTIASAALELHTGNATGAAERLAEARDVAASQGALALEARIRALESAIAKALGFNPHSTSDASATASV